MTALTVGYNEFITSKINVGADHGFEPTFLPDCLFDFQAAMLEYAVRKGRAALFEDCGMGKTVQFLAWSQNIIEHTNKPVLVLSPLAVSAQTLRESQKFGMDAEVSRDGKFTGTRIVITNYEKIHLFNSRDFSGVVCDESSCLKSADAARRNDITRFMRKVPYRLLCTATAAPNDYLELGTSSEALGYLGFMDMLNRFFQNDNNNSGLRRMYGEAPKWRFRGHSEIPFWRWVCSWARALRKPSDLGFDDGPFILPELTETEHLVEAMTLPDGMLFPAPAMNLQEQREERKRTLIERCERVAELVNHDKPAIVWTHLNAEADWLEKNIGGAVQVSGSQKNDLKEDRLLGFADGQFRVLVTKPKIGAHGLNFQHCAHITYFPSHSYEQYYQAVRRCWRFGQKSPVQVDIVMTEGDRAVMANLKRKSGQADRMFDNLVAEMHNAISIKHVDRFKKQLRAPSWLKSGGNNGGYRSSRN
jgi:hypothetical protein